MLGNVDRAMKALLIVGGLNWLSVAAGKFDFVAGHRFGRTHVPARVIYGLVGGSALYTLSRWIQQEAFSGAKAQPQPRRRVRDAMTTYPATIEPSATVAAAAKLMKTKDVGSLPVVEADQLVGILTDRDIAVRVVAEEGDPSSTSVAAVASRDPETVSPEQDLDSALILMARQQIRRLPVTQAGQLVGMLAQADVAKEAPPAETGETVRKISQ
jgi:CBS domain-containing protein